MKKHTLLLLVLISICSCAEEMIKKPENLIPKEKMANILYDLAIINAAKNTSAEILRENNIETMPYIYAKYDVDSLQFVKSDIYYSSVPLEHQAIYVSVEKKLEQKKEALNAKRMTKDSLKKLSDKNKKHIDIKKSTKAVDQ